ncbi:MAG TPA: FAD-binding oxidoreductase [Acidimicrobiales bacterium]|nr:FAD-binding oxidoreductase [Acidimicrobiales bacterium]
MTRPTPPIEFGRDFSEVTGRLARGIDMPDTWIKTMKDVCDDVSVTDEDLAESSRDWWPLALHWSLEGQVPVRASVVVRPKSTQEVAAILKACNENRIPVTPMAGRSGVCGSSVPLFGGVALDMCSMAGVIDVDENSLIATVLPGTFGPDLELALRNKGCTLGHWPQSVAISTVGGWLACRGAGQYSTRYGKIEDMVLGLEVVLADGTVIRTDGTAPRSATGPGLTGLFVGSEGILGVITEASFKLHPTPEVERRVAFGFPSFADGLETCRRILRRGSTPAVLRLYDEVETKRNFNLEGQNLLIVLDEGDAICTDAAMSVVEQECSGAEVLDISYVDKWLSHRNDTGALQDLTRLGIVVDTIEIAASWTALDQLSQDAIACMKAIPGNLNASVHQSHAYTSGACLYFTFAGNAPEGTQDPKAWAADFYKDSWQAVMDATIANGGAISHHHGIGINRARFMQPSLGIGTMALLSALKNALDPNGILNPGKLGLGTSLGELPWPE